MTDKVQKIREEVEKRYKYWREKESNSHSIESEIRMSECQHLLLMLNSMQEEPVSEDLEEAASRYAKEEYNRKSSATLPDRCKGCYAPLMYAFKAGAKWQKEKDAILPHIRHRDTLEEFAYQCAYDLSNDWARESPEWKDVKTACKLGAQWQKEQMMVKAIDGEILEIEDDDCSMCSHTHLELCIESDILEKNGFKNNDKVKVIVIKED